MVGQADAVDSVLSSVAAAAGARLFEITHEIWRLLTDDIPQLRGDGVVEKLLAASVEENVATLLHVFEHGTTADEVDAPAAAVEYARRLAQRHMPIEALVRAYRIGHGRFLARCIEEMATRPADAGLTAAVTNRMVEVSFRYIDRVSEQVVEIYQQERDRWLLTQTAMRAARVRALLSDQPVDITATEAALGLSPWPIPSRHRCVGNRKCGWQRWPDSYRTALVGCRSHSGKTRSRPFRAP